MNKTDSSVISFAAIKLTETGTNTLSNENGTFKFSIPPDLKNLTFEISSIGSKAIIHYHRTFGDVEKIYVDVLPDTLQEFSFIGWTAEEVVKKAVKAIPANYADSSYFSYSSYRQYEQVNGVFRNLIEAKPVVMFRLTKTRHEITSMEAFAVKHYRASTIIKVPEMDIAEYNDADMK